MTICFSQLPLETQRDIAETLVYCFPTMNERQRVYQIANVYIPFHSIADPVEIWMYVFQTIQKNPKKTHALLEASHFILNNRYEEVVVSMQSSQDESVNQSAIDFGTDASSDTQLKQDVHDQTLEALSLLEEICIILEAQNIVKNTSNTNFVSNMPSRSSNKFTNGMFSGNNSHKKNPNSRLSGQFVFGMAAVMLLSVGFSFSLSSNADQRTINGQQVSVNTPINTKKTQLTNINVETRIKKLPSNSVHSKNDKSQNDKDSDYVSISSQHLGTQQYKSKTGITLENVKNETLSSVREKSTDDTILQNNKIHSNINNSLVSPSEISLKNTEASSSFVPSIEKESQVFKDPLAAAISKATDRLIEQHQKTTQSQTSTTNNSTINKKKVSTVVPLLQGSDVPVGSKVTVSDTQLNPKNKNTKKTTNAQSKVWKKCSGSSNGTLYGYWWAGKISGEEEKFTSGQIVYIGNWSNVRKGPSSKTDKVCVLQPGQQIKLKEDAKTYGNSQWVAIYSDSIQ